MSDGQDNFMDGHEDEEWRKRNYRTLSADGKSMETFRDGKLVKVESLDGPREEDSDERFDKEFAKAVQDLRAEDVKEQRKKMEETGLSRWAAKR